MSRRDRHRRERPGRSQAWHHCHEARAVLPCSSTAVYQPAGHRALAEDDPLGDNHRVRGPLQTYGITKIAEEVMALYCARALGLPTTIARLNVPYGDHGGRPTMHTEMVLAGQPVPERVDAPSTYNPIHHDDVVAMVPRLLEVASVPATTVNWAGTSRRASSSGAPTSPSSPACRCASCPPTRRSAA